MLRKIWFVILILSIYFSLSADFRIQVIYHDLYYNLALYETKSYPLEKPLYVSRIIDKNQLHRIRLDAMARSKLDSLLYVGDDYRFQGVRLSLVSSKIYLIEDVENNFSIRFSVADYHSVVLHSYLNFYNPRWNAFQDIQELDYIATAITVKKLLNQLMGNTELQSDLPLVISEEEMERFSFDMPDQVELIKRYYLRNKKETGYYLKQNLTPEQEEEIRAVLDQVGYQFSKTLTPKERLEAYQNFVKQLGAYGTQEQIFLKLTEFVTINFKVIDEYMISEDWINPYDLLYEKKGDYKSIAFFYYYTLKQLNAMCEAYFVIPLERRKDPDRKSYSQEEKKTILLEHKINPASNLDFRKYEFPDLRKAVFLVTFQYQGFWVYTTGKKWIYTDITKKERVVSHYSKNGCYYSVLKDTQAIIENIPLQERQMRWDVFFDISNDPN